jgi:hypothetical protein
MRNSAAHSLLAKTPNKVLSASAIIIARRSAAYV